MDLIADVNPARRRPGRSAVTLRAGRETLSSPGIVRGLAMAAAVVVTLVIGPSGPMFSMRSPTAPFSARRAGAGWSWRGVVVTLVTGVLVGGKIVAVGSLGPGSSHSGEPDGHAASAGEGAYELAGQILARLEAGGRTVAVAESLTGGLVAAALTDIPGASAAFRGGVVTYATGLKASLLGVDRDMLARHGAVYAPVAAAMAGGVRTRLGATYGVATTGVAVRSPQTGSQWARCTSPSAPRTTPWCAPSC